MLHSNRLAALVRHRRDDYVALLQRLVRATPSGEAGVQTVVADAFAALGLVVDRFTYRPQALVIDYELLDPADRAPDEHVCVVGQWPGAGQGRDALFFAHPDGEPISGTEHWHRDPFAGVTENGRLYGWGVADDLLGVATMTAALDLVLAAGLTPAGRVTLASTPSKRRAQGIVAVLDRGYPADGVVYLHPAESGAGLDEIKALTSGILHFRITVVGQPPDTSEPSHTAFAHRAVNPLDKAWLVYQALQALDAERGATVHHPALAATVGRSTNLLVSHVACGDAEHIGRVSPTCVLGGTVAFPPGETLRDVQAQVGRAVKAATEADSWLRTHPPRLDWLWGVGSAATATDHPLYRTVAEAIHAVTDVEPHVNPLHTASDIRNPILHRGIPCVGFGSLAGDLSQNGCTDEWIDIEDYLRAVHAAAQVIVAWCGTAG